MLMMMMLMHVIIHWFIGNMIVIIDRSTKDGDRWHFILFRHGLFMIHHHQLLLLLRPALEDWQSLRNKAA